MRPPARLPIWVEGNPLCESQWIRLCDKSAAQLSTTVAALPCEYSSTTLPHAQQENPERPAHSRQVVLAVMARSKQKTLWKWASRLKCAKFFEQKGAEITKGEFLSGRQCANLSMNNFAIFATFC